MRYSLMVRLVLIVLVLSAIAMLVADSPWGPD